MPRTKKTTVQETTKNAVQKKPSEKGMYYQVVKKSADGKTLESIKKQY